MVTFQCSTVKLRGIFQTLLHKATYMFEGILFLDGYIGIHGKLGNR